jgi:hypothetical protein
LSRGGRSSPANDSDCNTHGDSVTSRRGGRLGTLALDLTDVLLLRLLAATSNMSEQLTLRSGAEQPATEVPAALARLRPELFRVSRFSRVAGEQAGEDARASLDGGGADDAVGGGGGGGLLWLRELRLAPVELLLTFHRRTDWCSPQLGALAMLKRDFTVEALSLALPELKLRRVLGDTATMVARIVRKLEPSLMAQWPMILQCAGGSWVAAGLQSAVEGLGASSVLQEKATALGFQADGGPQPGSKKLVARQLAWMANEASVAGLERGLWRLLWAWDASHTGIDAQRRRCLGMLLVNHSSRPLIVTGVKLRKGDSQQLLQPRQLGTSGGASVLFAHAGMHVGGAVLGTTAEVEVEVQTSVGLTLRVGGDALDVRGAGRGAGGSSGRGGGGAQVRANVVGVDLHKWWSRWLVLISDAVLCIDPS